MKSHKLLTLYPILSLLSIYTATAAAASSSPQPSISQVFNPSSNITGPSPPLQKLSYNGSVPLLFASFYPNPLVLQIQLCSVLRPKQQYSPRLRPAKTAHCSRRRPHVPCHSSRRNLRPACNSNAPRLQQLLLPFGVRPHTRPRSNARKDAYIWRYGHYVERSWRVYD